MTERRVTIAGGPLERVLGALTSRGLAIKPTGAGRHMAQCPAHEDRSPSLSILNESTPDGERVLVNCFAGCPAERVLSTLGLEFAALYERVRPIGRRRPGRTVPPNVLGPLRAHRCDREADRLLVVAGAAGLDVRADARLDYLWHITCPCCGERLGLLLEETGDGSARMSCRSGCDTDRIHERFASVVRRRGGWVTR